MAELKNMQNPRLATRYAKSLLDLAKEQNSLDATLSDMQLLNNICIQNRDFALMLRSPIISSEKKQAILNAVMKDRVGPITFAFINLLITKGRELNLAEIATAFITQYNAEKNIRSVKLTTAVPMDDSTRKGIVAKVAGYMPNDKVSVETATDESLIGGFILEVEDKLYDASVRKSLNDIKTKLLDYTYVSKI